MECIGLVLVTILGKVTYNTLDHTRALNNKKVKWEYIQATIGGSCPGSSDHK